MQTVFSGTNPVEYDWVCFFGALDGAAETVLPACDRAVELAPDEDYVYFGRAIARALTGDLSGSASDFQRHLEILGQDDPILLEWIAALENGENPITDEVIVDLREQYSE
jgi:hypothetical protein